MDVLQVSPNTWLHPEGALTCRACAHVTLNVPLIVCTFAPSAVEGFPRSTPQGASLLPLPPLSCTLSSCRTWQLTWTRHSATLCGWTRPGLSRRVPRPSAPSQQPSLPRPSKLKMPSKGVMLAWYFRCASLCALRSLHRQPHRMYSVHFSLCLPAQNSIWSGTAKLLVYLPTPNILHQACAPHCSAFDIVCTWDINGHGGYLFRICPHFGRRPVGIGGAPFHHAPNCNLPSELFAAAAGHKLSTAHGRCCCSVGGVNSRMSQTVPVI